MKVLGVRVDPSATRYALVSEASGQLQLLNSAGESRWLYPADAKSTDDKALWVYRELERLFRDHADIQKVCIKTNEYGLAETKAKRESAHIEGAVLLFCAQHGLPVDVWTYGSLGTRSADVKEHAEGRVGRTAKYWDGKMADAIIAAWKGAKP